MSVTWTVTQKVLNSKIQIEWITDLWYGYTVYGEFGYCTIFRNIDKYAQFCSILLNIVLYWLKLVNIS